RRRRDRRLRAGAAGAERRAPARRPHRLGLPAQARFLGGRARLASPLSRPSSLATPFSQAVPRWSLDRRNPFGRPTLSGAAARRSRSARSLTRDVACTTLSKWIPTWANTGAIRGRVLRSTPR